MAKRKSEEEYSVMTAKEDRETHKLPTLPNSGLLPVCGEKELRSAFKQTQYKSVDPSEYRLPSGWEMVDTEEAVPIPCNLIYPDGSVKSVKFPDDIYGISKGYVGFQKILPLESVGRFQACHGPRPYWAVEDRYDGEHVANRIDTRENAKLIAKFYNSFNPDELSE